MYRKLFKGAAITLVVAGILSMAFMGFTGGYGTEKRLKKDAQKTSASLYDPQTDDFQKHALQTPLHAIQKTGKEKLS
ncbi:MAG: hypothetical protein R2874_06870 [Desulfobacterales bacterium]